MSILQTVTLDDFLSEHSEQPDGAYVLVAAGSVRRLALSQRLLAHRDALHCVLLKAAIGVLDEHGLAVSCEHESKWTGTDAQQAALARLWDAVDAILPPIPEDTEETP